jgi:threonine/homoserine/homoserine lactone efflux protein
MEIIFNGIISGMVLALLIGPVFFTLLQTSIERGFRSGFFVAIGVSLSDAVYISLSYLGIYQLFDKGNFREYLSYFGGGVLLLFGLYYLIYKTRKKIGGFGPQAMPSRNPYRLILKGFVINGLSPMVLIFWLGTVGVATTKFGYATPGTAIPYFAAIVGTVLMTDILKAKLADRLRIVLTPNFIRTLNIVVGVLMVIFGGRLIVLADTLTAF